MSFDSYTFVRFIICPRHCEDGNPDYTKLFRDFPNDCSLRILNLLTKEECRERGIEIVTNMNAKVKPEKHSTFNGFFHFCKNEIESLIFEHKYITYHFIISQDNSKGNSSHAVMVLHNPQGMVPRPLDKEPIGPVYRNILEDLKEAIMHSSLGTCYTDADYQATDYSELLKKCSKQNLN